MIIIREKEVTKGKSRVAEKFDSFFRTVINDLSMETWNGFYVFGCGGRVSSNLIPIVGQLDIKDDSALTYTPLRSNRHLIAIRGDAISDIKGDRRRTIVRCKDGTSFEFHK